MTGRYPHSHGAIHNDLPLNADEFTLGHMFQRAGYETGYAGKWHLDGKNDPTWPDWIPEERSFGFADHKWMFNQGHWKRIEERPEGWPNNRSVATSSQSFDGTKVENNLTDRHNYVSVQSDGRPNESYSVAVKGEYFSDWLTDKAVEFIRRPRTSPFFYVLSFPDPHSPFTVDSKYSSMFPRDSVQRHPCVATVWLSMISRYVLRYPTIVNSVPKPKRFSMLGLIPRSESGDCREPMNSTSTSRIVCWGLS